MIDNKNILLYNINEHDANILDCTIALAFGRAQARVRCKGAR